MRLKRLLDLSLALREWGLTYSRLWILIYDLKSVAAKAATATTVPTPLQYRAAVNGQLSKTGHASDALPIKGIQVWSIWKSRKWKWNRNWKWKLETEMGTKNTPITGAMFLFSYIVQYSCTIYLAVVIELALIMSHVLCSCVVLCDCCF